MSTVTMPESTTTAAEPATQGLDPGSAVSLQPGALRGARRIGAFSKRDRFHLINGYLVAKMTQNPPHTTADDLCGAASSG